MAGSRGKQGHFHVLSPKVVKVCRILSILGACRTASGFTILQIFRINYEGDTTSCIILRLHFSSCMSKKWLNPPLYYVLSTALKVYVQFNFFCYKNYSFIFKMCIFILHIEVRYLVL